MDLSKIGTKWVKSSGEVRYYINDWKDLIGLKVDYYKTGNVANVECNGERWSNRFYIRNVKNTKVWIDEDGEPHIDYCYDEDVKRLIILALAKKITEVYKIE